MKKAGKVFIYIFLILFVLTGFIIGYVKLGLPDVGKAEEVKVQLTAARLERGKYLANNVTLCIDCHSQRDWTKFSGPPKLNSIGQGGEVFDESIGFPGAVYSPNITSFNLQSWTDGELFRLITTGVTKHGQAAINIMPYSSYGKMDKEDIYAIIAYIRTLPGISSSFPQRELNFPLNLIVNTIPTKADLQKIPAESDKQRYGGYLVNAAACVDCHTKQEKGNNIAGMEFAGSRAFSSATGTLYSANITPDKQTGIGNWTEEQFVKRFKSYANGYVPHTIKEGDFQTIMPWMMYAGMKESDLGAMYTYLKTLTPIKNHVVRFERK